MLEHSLRIPRGAVFYGFGLTLKDRQGNPIRSVDGLSVVSKVRRYLGASEVLHTFDTSIQLMVLAGHYDDLPIAVAQIDRMTHLETAALAFETGVWDMQVNHEQPIAGGLIFAPLVVSR